MNHHRTLASGSREPLTFSNRSLNMNIPIDDLPSTNLWEFLLWILGRRKRFRVSGPSMLPLLQPDEEVLVNQHAYGLGHRPQSGDVVIVVHPHKPSLRMVKRVIEGMQTPEGSLGSAKATSSIEAQETYYWIEGDNLLASTDSRTFGPVPSACILGKVTARFA